MKFYRSVHSLKKPENPTTYGYRSDTPNLVSTKIYHSNSFLNSRKAHTPRQHITKMYWTLGILLLGWTTTVAQNNKTQLELERNALLQRIKTMEQVLQQTKTQKTAGINQVNAWNVQIEARTQLIQITHQVLRSIEQEIRQQQQRIATLTQDLAQLQKEYTAMLEVGVKSLHNMNPLIFIFSTPSFHVLSQRLQYIRQYARIRKKHCLEIVKLKTMRKDQQSDAIKRMHRQRTLLHQQQAEKKKLMHLKQQQTQLISKLNHRHTQLTQELQQHNQGVKRLNTLIQKIIPPPPRPVKPPTNTQASTKKPTQAGQSDTWQEHTSAFRKSRGKLSWPVKTGFISKRFGIAPHPIFSNVQVENSGIDIQSTPGASVYPIFEGVVKAIAVVPNMQHVVIIQHGSYHSVYARLQRTVVTVGQSVHTQTPIGVLYTDTKGISLLQLQIWRGTQKLNPHGWLRKQ